MIYKTTHPKCIFAFALFMLFSCISQAQLSKKIETKYNSRGFDIEHDAVTNSKKITMESVLYDAKNFSPLIKLEQAVVKEIKSNNTYSYKIFDILFLKPNSFALTDTAYIVIDKEVFKLVPEYKEFGIVKNVSSSNTEVLKSDSSKTTVLSGYDENNEKIVRFCYPLPNAVAEKIKTSEMIVLQYYAGHKIIRIEFKNERLNRFIRFLNQE